jgi:branched-chain amino acid transport system ATP-binding protein
VIEVKDLTVRFGGVTPLDSMSVTFERGTCGLIGPNGAGKTTFFNVLSGFVKPVSGTVTAFGEDLLSMTHFRRARWGVRRTFQTEQAIEELSVFDNVAMIHEHSKVAAGSRRDDVLGAIEFVKLNVDPNAKVGTLGAAQRRLVEVARAVVGKPRLVLLDEPAAGLPEAERHELLATISGLPADVTVLLIEHDMDLVFSFADRISVLVNGALFVDGAPEEVARDPRVKAVYLGEELDD